MKDYSTLNCRVEGGVTEILFNRPSSYNAITTEMFSELLDALDSANSDDSTSVIILSGVGNEAFSSGVDLKEDFLSSGKQTEAALNRYALPLIESILSSTKPVIAGVNGLCVGIGCSIALACDYLMMKDKASLDFSFLKLGLIADGGSNWLMQKKLGHNKAFSTILKSRKISSDECKELGLAAEIISVNDFRETAMSSAKVIAENSDIVLQNLKKMFKLTNAAERESFTEAFLKESNLQGQCIDSAEFKQRLKYFNSK